MKTTYALVTLTMRIAVEHSDKIDTEAVEEAFNGLEVTKVRMTAEGKTLKVIASDVVEVEDVDVVP